MIPISDIEVLQAGDVVHHPEHGYAVVEDIDPSGAIRLRWEKPGVDRPAEIDSDEVATSFRLCAPMGFLARSVLERERLVALAERDPIGTLRLLLEELGEPLGRKDIQRWLVERAGLEPLEFEHWWDRVRRQVTEAPDFHWQGEQLTRMGGAASSGGESVAAWRSFSRQSPPARFRTFLAASSHHRDNLLAAALHERDADAVLLMLRGRQEVPVAYVDDLVKLALDDEPRLFAALIDRRVGAAEEALRGLLGRRDHRALVEETLSALRDSRRVPLILTLVEGALARGKDEATARHLVAQLPGGAARALADIGSGRYAGLDGGSSGGWASAIRWLREEAGRSARTEGRPVGEKSMLSALRRLPAPRLFGVGIALARTLAERHAGGRHGGLQGARIAEDDTVELGPPEDSTPSQDVFDAMRSLVELAIGQLPRGTRLDSDVLLYHLADLVPDAPPEWVAVATRALASEPADRHANAVALWAHLEEARALYEVRKLVPPMPGGLRVGHDTHIGRVKSRLGQVNQDALFWQTEGPLSLLVVADGISVSTAGSGNLASAILVQVVVGLWEQRFSALAGGSDQAIRAFLDDALAAANRAICEGSLRLAGGDLSRHIPMGTTALVAVVRGNRVFLASLGDSRIYLVSSVGTAQLTADQNLRGEWLRSWQNGEPADLFSEGHALVGYAGHFDEDGDPAPVPPRHASLTLLPGETLVLCSDGLTDYAARSASEMARLFEQAFAGTDLDAACRALVEKANAGDGGDNITIVTARLGSPG